MNSREAIAEAIRYGERAYAINKSLFVIERLRTLGFVILPRSEVEKRDKEMAVLRETMELARSVLAKSLTAGYKIPGPTQADIEKAFWALDATLKDTLEDSDERA